MIDISLRGIVFGVLILLAAAIIYALLHYLISYIAKEFPNSNVFVRAARIFLVVAAVLFLIAFVLHVVGFPLFNFRVHHEKPPTRSVLLATAAGRSEADGERRRRHRHGGSRLSDHRVSARLCAPA